MTVLLLMFFAINTTAQEWSSFPVPANAGQGKEWQLQSNISDDFNYRMSEGDRPTAFTDKWYPRYHNNWTGPGKTLWNSPQAWSDGDKLAIQAVRVPGTDQVYCGIITNKKRIKYPVYFEISAKIMNQKLANAFWLLSPDDTQEIDAMEGYGGGEGQQWFAERMHISHHVFIRSPFQDYQPKDDGSWHRRQPAGTVWRAAFHRYGCYWKDPWTLEYYIDGKLVRTVSGRDKIDPLGYTNGTGLNKEMDIIIDAENQTDWRPDPTDAELESGNIFWVDWMRVYKPVNGSGGGNTGGDNSGGGNNNSGQLIANGLYRLTNPRLNQSLLARALENHDARLVNTGNFADQQWRFNHLGNNVYTIKNNGTGRYLEVQSAQCFNGGNVKTWTNFSGDHKKWKVEKNGSVYMLKPTHCLSRALDVAAGQRDGQIHIWAANTNNNNQKWNIVRLGNKELTDLESEISIYPNPVLSGSTLNIEGLKEGSSVTIFNSAGQQVKQIYAGGESIEVEISDMAPGVYFIQIDKNEVLKLVVG